MPSTSRRRKAKKKKQAGEAHAHNQHQGIKEDSGNGQELENEHEHDHDHGQEQDHGHEEEPVTPKTPVQTDEGEEKEKGEVGGGSSDAEEIGSRDHGFNQNHEISTQTSFQEPQSTDINLVIPENGGGGLGNEVEILSGGASEDKNGPIGNLSPLASTEAPARTSSSSSSNHFRDNGDETHHDEEGIGTDVGLIALGAHDGDECEVSSSTLVVSEEKVPNQILGPSTHENETVPSTKNDDDTHVDVEAPSEELDSSDGDESKLDVVSTMATLDANESIQSVDSVDSPRSFYSQQYLDQSSNERAELADQDRGSEGFSETPFQGLGSKVDFVNAEADEKPVYKDQIEDTEFPQEEDGHENSLSEESLKGLRNENIQVSTEFVSDNYATVMEELTQVVSELEKTQVGSSVSLATFNEETEAIYKVDKNDAKESVMPLSKSESVNTRHMSVLSNNGEAVENVVSTGEAIGDAISATGQADQDVVSASGSAKDGVGSIKVQGTSADPNEISDKKIAVLPRNGTNEEKANLRQSETRTSWLSCCGLMDLFTSARS